MKRLFPVSLVLAAMLAACGGTSGAAGPAAPGADAPPAERAVLLFESLARELADASHDCDQIAAALLAFTETHQDAYPTLGRAAAATELPAEQRQSHERALRAALDTVVDAVLGCATHPGTQEAYSRFDALVDPE